MWINDSCTSDQGRYDTVSARDFYRFLMWHAACFVRNINKSGFQTRHDKIKCLFNYNLVTPCFKHKQSSNDAMLLFRFLFHYGMYSYLYLAEQLEQPLRTPWNSVDPAFGTGINFTTPARPRATVWHGIGLLVSRCSYSTSSSVSAAWATILLYNQPPRATQPSVLVGSLNEERAMKMGWCTAYCRRGWGLPPTNTECVLIAGLTPLKQRWRLLPHAVDYERCTRKLGIFTYLMTYVTPSEGNKCFAS